MTEKQQMNSRSIIDQYIIILLDSNINHSNENIKNSLNNIRHIVNSIKTFTSIDQCITFLPSIKKTKIFMIITDSFDQEDLRLINLIEETSQIDSVYIFSTDPTKPNQLNTKCKKIKGIFTHIEHICDSLEENICPSEGDSSTMSIISTTSNNLDELDQSYMYSKLLTELILKINYNDTEKKEFFDFYREQYIDNDTILKAIDGFERDYQCYTPIYWYTKELLIYSHLNNALITQNIDIMIKMGFFMQDLHREIEQIYFITPQTSKITVYRGHGMSKKDFEKILTQKGGLYTFHNFLSTSTNEEVALHFASFQRSDPEIIGILFQMEIEPFICSIPFASLDKTSFYLDSENEVLFSTHTVFRIGQINKLEDRLWQINLTLTRDTDPQLKLLTYHIRNEIQSLTPWHSMAILMYKMGKYDKAIEILNRIIEITDEGEFITALASIYNNIGLINDSMENYSIALSWYEKSLEIQQKSLSSDHPSFATVYNNIAMIYRSMGDYAKALSYCEKSLEIRLKSTSSNQTSLTTIYSNIGMVYESKGDYSIALSYYEKAYEIQKTSLPLDHPSFTLSYNNFGGVYNLMGKYSIARRYYEKTLEIQETSLPPNHPSIAIAYNNIGHVYQLIGNYSTSLLYYEEALKIQQKNFPLNQLSLATTYNNIGLLHRLMGNDITALSYYEKALEIEEISLSVDHPTLAFTYNNIGAGYQSTGDHSAALTNYKKTLKIWQKSLPPNHSSLATIHNNIGSVFDSMGDYKKALSYYEKAIEIQQKLLSSNPLDVASTYNNMGEAYRSLDDYTNAQLYYQKTLDIEQQHLSNNHPSLAITLGNMAVAFDANHQYEEAFEHAQQALNIVRHAFGCNHPRTKENQAYFDQLREKLTHEPTILVNTIS